MGNQIKSHQSTKYASGKNPKCNIPLVLIPDLFKIIQQPCITELQRFFFEKLIESEKQFVQQQGNIKKIERKLKLLKKEIKILQHECQTLRENKTTLRVIR